MKLKQIYFSIRDAIAYRGVRDPNKNVTISSGDSFGTPGYATPGINSALQLSVVWACIRLIAETISTLPLITYQREGETRTVARDHPLYYLLHDSPNADMTAVEFWEAVIFQLCTWGNAYVLKTRNGAGKIIALYPLNPAWMSVRQPYGSAPAYIFADPRGQVEYSDYEVWHIKGFGADGVTGLSPVGVGWRSMYGATAVTRAASDTFTNNMRVQGVVSVKEYLDATQRAQMKDKVMGAVFGNSQTGQLQLLEGGAEFKQLSLNPVDAQMLESLAFSVEDLCRWFNMPPSLIGHGTAVSNWGTGREQINLGFLQYVLRPYLVRIEQGVKKSLMSPTERLKYYVEYSLEGLLRADSAARAAYYSTLVQNGLKTRNECRALENDPPLPGGGELTVQSNLIPITLLGKITNTAQAAKTAMLGWLGIEQKDDHEA